MRFWSQSPQDRPQVRTPGTAQGLGIPTFLEPARISEAVLTGGRRQQRQRLTRRPFTCISLSTSGLAFPLVFGARLTLCVHIWGPLIISSPGGEVIKLQKCSMKGHAWWLGAYRGRYGDLAWENRGPPRGSDGRNWVVVSRTFPGACSSRGLTR